jgi:hypothetical protein
MREKGHDRVLFIACLRIDTNERMEASMPQTELCTEEQNISRARKEADPARSRKGRKKTETQEINSKGIDRSINSSDVKVEAGDRWIDRSQRGL